MEKRTLCARRLRAFAEHLRREERAETTFEKDLRDAEAFAVWQRCGAVT